MQVEQTVLSGVLVITPKKFGDDRGFFSEVFNAHAFGEAVGDWTFVQDNQSLSATPGTIRGLHFQTEPHAQGKLVRVVRGALLDVAVDIRRSSPTFGRHVTVELSAANWKQLWIPPGFAHGFCTIEPNTEVLYKTTGFYAPSHDFGLAFDDPALGIQWPVDPAQALLSDKDRRQPRLENLADAFS